MANATKLLHLADAAPVAAGQAAEEVFIDNLAQGGDAPTTIPTGALVPGAGIDLTRADSGVLTCAVKAKGVTAAMLADGVAVSGNTRYVAVGPYTGGVSDRDFMVKK